MERIATIAIYHAWTLEGRQCHIATCSSVQSPPARREVVRSFIVVKCHRSIEQREPFIPERDGIGNRPQVPPNAKPAGKKRLASRRESR